MKINWLMPIVLLGVAFGLAREGMAGTAKGDFEVSGQFYFLSPSEGDETVTIFGSAGYFLTDNIQINGSSFIFISGGNTTGSFGPGVDYYFNPGADTVFYAGGSFQLDVSDNDASGSDTGSSFDIHVGAKRFLTERTTVNGTLGHNDGLDGQYLLLGLSYFF